MARWTRPGLWTLLVVLVVGCSDPAAEVPDAPEDAGELASAPSALESSGGAEAVPAGLSAAEWAQVTDHIAAERRELVWDERAPLGRGAWRADSRWRGMQAWLDGRVVQVRSAQGESWQVELELVGVGRAGAMVPPRDGEMSVEGTRLEIERGGLVEWYVNGERGLQQGFVLHEQPAGDGPLRLDLAVRGGLVPEVIESTRRDARFVDENGHSRARYEGLLVWDAGGRELDAWLEARGERLSIVVEDEGALWPLTIDPFVNPETQKLLASDKGSSDFLGWSVSISGPTLAVGARGKDDSGMNDNGAVYVFEHDGTSWVETQKLTASDMAGFDYFGNSVSLSGTTLAVGARLEDSGTSDNGAVYIFEHNGTSWVETQKLLASDMDTADEFGTSVSLSGSTLAIGAYSEDDSGTGDNGAVYVFEHDGTSWVQTQKLLASDKDSDDNFGHSVSLSGTTLAVGARLESDSGTTYNGAVYVFEYDGTSWVQTQKLLASDKASDDQFGWSVALSGTSLAVGAFVEDDSGTIDNGAVYVFEHNGTSWVETQKLLASDRVSTDQFGHSVALSGTSLAVGADSGASNNGAVYVFEHDGTSWVQTQKLTASDQANLDSFGHSVALSGTQLVVGAVGEDDSGTTGNGAVYVFAANTFPGAQDTSVTTDEDTAVLVTVSASDADGDALTFAVDTPPANGTLGAFTNVQHNGTTTTAEVTWTPSADYNGSDSFTFTASDGLDASAPATATLTINPVDDLPTVSEVADQTIDEDTSTGALAFTVGDVETAATDLTVTASTDNPALLPDTNLVLGGSDGDRTLTATPAAEQHGSATVTLTVTDADAGMASETFVLTVSPLSDAPVLDPLGGPYDVVAGTPFELTATASDGDGDPLTFSSPDLPAGATLDASSGAFSWTPGAQDIGEHTITIEVSDGVESDSGTFVVNVLMVGEDVMESGEDVAEPGDDVAEPGEDVAVMDTSVPDMGLPADMGGTGGGGSSDDGCCSTVRAQRRDPAPWPLGLGLVALVLVTLRRRRG